MRNGSGFFALSRGQWQIGEVQLQFQPRISGESKLNLALVGDLGISILRTLLLRSVPRRALSFGLVGATGIATHLLLFTLGRNLLGLGFEQAQILAVVSAATTNFLINHVLTFRRQQLKGFALLVGLVRFLMVTSLGLDRCRFIEVCLEHTLTPLDPRSPRLRRQPTP